MHIFHFERRSEHMDQRSPLAIVRAWQEAANAQDIDRLLQLSTPEIEIVGARGSGYGHQLLRDWLARAGLRLQTRRVFARDGVVVVARRGTWRATETDAVIGEQAVATAFRVADGRVARVARYDSLDIALAEAGLAEGDEVEEPKSIH
jgi:hypothetical protein